MHTRTFACYWSTHDVEGIQREARALREDFEKRRQYMAPEVAARMVRRLTILDEAILLMTEVSD